MTHFGSSGRENSNRLGTFKDMMQGGSSVKLYHPKWWATKERILYDVVFQDDIDNTILRLIPIYIFNKKNKQTRKHTLIYK